MNVMTAKTNLLDAHPIGQVEARHTARQLQTPAHISAWEDRERSLVEREKKITDK